MSNAFNLVKGLAISSNSIIFLPFTVITKAPLRGFSLLIATFKPAALPALSTFALLLLKAPQDLHASTIMSADTDEVLEGDSSFFVGFSAFFTVFLVVLVVLAAILYNIL